jgi:YfiH family protein
VKNNTYAFNIFSQFNGLVHGISTRHYGSMKDQGQINFSNINAFLGTLDTDPDRLVLSEQVHGSNCIILNDIPAEKLIKNADGLIAVKKNILIGVVTADCLPILLYDSKKSIVGVAHGGYKGISKQIINKIIKKFHNLGSNIDDVYAGIGPAAGACCYEVSKDKIEMFQEIFPSYNDWYRKENGRFFLDLKKIAFLNLKEEGIRQEKIEVSDICTIHRTDRFFSYRKEGEKAGRFISIIGTV